MEHANRELEFLEEVRNRMRQTLDTSAIAEIEQRHAEDLYRLREAARDLRKQCSRMGSLPPQPDSFRARVGMWLVRMVRQALFWYTPQIAGFQSTTAGAVELQVALFEAMSRRLERTEARVAALQLELDRRTGRE